MLSLLLLFVAAVFGLGGYFYGLVARGKALRQVTAREEVRFIDVPKEVGCCSKCSGLLRPIGFPKQLYLELWDVHGNQRAQWPIGGGGNLHAVQLSNEEGLTKLFRQVCESVERGNSFDGIEAAPARRVGVS